MLDANAPSDERSAGVALFAAGAHAKGEFHCADCGYGVAVFRELPLCPMCGNDAWEQSEWSPFARARLIAQ